MPEAISPGTYLRKRRLACGLSIADVAQAIATEPRLAHHLRIEWIDLIERDEMPATVGTIIALRSVIRFDLGVLVKLVDRDPRQTAPRICRICACSDDCPCRLPSNGPCSWTTADLCSACDDDLLNAAALATPSTTGLAA